MGLLHTPAIPLRKHPYGETSLILRFYTRELGIVGVMAKGARRRGSRGGGGVPETFARGVLTLYVKDRRDLQTMKEFSLERGRRGVARHVLRFAGASTLGEILLRHAEGGESADLFHRLDRALDRIETEPEDALISRVLAEGWGLVSALGFRPVLDACVACGAPLSGKGLARFDFGEGGLRCTACSQGARGPRMGTGARTQLSRLLETEVVEELSRPRAHLRLLSNFVTFHLSGGRPVESLRILLDLFGSDGGA